MNRLWLRTGFCFFLMLFAACKDITHVQTGYVADRDECRGRSENNVGVYSQPESYPVSDKERSTALLQLFCECMKEKDWKVAGCPKPATAVAATQPPAPTVVVVQAPTAQPAVLPMASQPVQQASPPATTAAPLHKKKPQKVCVPQNGSCQAPADTSSGSAGQTPIQGDQQLNGILQRQ